MTIVSIGNDSVLVAQSSFGVVVSFRGTLPPFADDFDEYTNVFRDWLNDTKFTPTEVAYSAGRVHSGFAESLEHLWGEGDLLNVVQAAAQGGRQVFITGHSKGGAIATLAARRFKAAGIFPSGVITFGSPRVGDGRFAKIYNDEIPKHWRVEHQDDIAVHIPPNSPFVIDALKGIPQVTDLFARIGRDTSQYSSVGHLCFLNKSSVLIEEDTPLLAFSRLRDLLSAGEGLLWDHCLDATHLPQGRLGYIEAIDKLLPRPQ